MPRAKPKRTSSKPRPPRFTASDQVWVSMFCAVQEQLDVLNCYFGDSKESREDNLPTLWALRREIHELASNIADTKSGQAVLESRMQSIAEALKPIVGHCQALARENESLRRWSEANRSVTDAARGDAAAESTYVFGPCAFKSAHLPGIRCAVCGHLEIVYTGQIPL